ncbi:hypothetical protein PoB_007619300 [Plakobranchus ocellatus]|uniref:G-protein coupled receptors family 1 profile domain-containing protein n=1 Tax=Plakobranchus ocellatus TaxID=259542 RepID=A0AAV4E000_9GAST|nr:hypothetical protein PoB_007619300 [Plakobranchus ocellatus]
MSGRAAVCKKCGHISSILIIGSNLLLLGVILYSPGLRRTPRNALVVGISVADLLMGCFVMPMFTRTLVESQFPDCHTHLAVQLISGHVIFFIVGWTLVILNILNLIRRRRQSRLKSDSQTDHQANTSTPRSSPSFVPRPQTLPLSPQCSGQALRRVPSRRMPGQPGSYHTPLSPQNPYSPYFLPCTSPCSTLFPAWLRTAALAALPWAAAIITVVPVVVLPVSRIIFGEGEHYEESVMCMLILPRSVLLVAASLSFYLPFYLCVGFLVTIIFCYSRGARYRDYSYHGPLQDQNGFTEAIGLEGPEQVMSGSDAERDTEAEEEVEDRANDTNVTVQPDLADRESNNRSLTSPSSVQTTDNTTIPPNSSRDSCSHTQEQQVTSNNLQNESRDYGAQNNMLGNSFPLEIYTECELSLAHCVPNAVYLICYAPLMVFTWSRFSNGRVSEHAYGLILFMMLSRSFIMPFAWMVFADIRREASELWVLLKLSLVTLCSRNRTEAASGSSGRTSLSTASPISFSRLHETQVV